MSLLLAALACVLRPTNALIWLSVSVPTLWEASNRLRYVLLREILLCG
jgi:phosphatidylinositol glycan class B